MTRWPASVSSMVHVGPPPPCAAHTLLCHSSHPQPNPPPCPQLRLACEGILQTLGRLSWPGGTQVGDSMTAHPKVDPETGELFFFG
jgi:hypothetical protein